MRVVAALTIFLLSWTSSPAVAGGDSIAVERLRPDAPAFTLNSGLDERGQFVARDAVEWASIWQRVHARSRPSPPPPEVDFGREIVVVAAVGRQRSGGYAIRIDRAYLEGAKTIIVVREESPASGCVVVAAMTSPVDIARLPALDGPVEFRVESIVRDCNQSPDGAITPATGAP